jgi:hypothetical protein
MAVLCKLTGHTLPTAAATVAATGSITKPPLDAPFQAHAWQG